MKTAAQLQEEIDWHDCQETMADAIGDYPEAVKHHREAREVLQAQLDRFFPGYVHEYPEVP